MTPPGEDLGGAARSSITGVIGNEHVKPLRIFCRQVGHDIDPAVTFQIVVMSEFLLGNSLFFGDGLEFDHAGSPGGALFAPAWRPQGLRVLISDLLWPEEPRVVVGRLAEHAAGVIVVMVLARADVEPPPRGNVRLEEVEGGGTHEIMNEVIARFSGW